jgi:hypothetical protein
MKPVVIIWESYSKQKTDSENVPFVFPVVIILGCLQQYIKNPLPNGDFYATRLFQSYLQRRV